MDRETLLKFCEPDNKRVEEVIRPKVTFIACDDADTMRE
jgi:hypothetical protein